MEPSQVLPYFQVAGQIALILGAVFAAYQLFQLERNRREQLSLQTVTAFTTQEFRDAFARVNGLPTGADADAVRSDERMEAAAHTVMMTFEMLGVLVYNHMVPIDT